MKMPELSQADLIRIQNVFDNQVLSALGMPTVDDENFHDTAKRWLKFIREFMIPYDPREHLSKSFQPKIRETQDASRYGQALVVQNNIPFQAVCAHHLVPVLGRAAVGYIPSERVVGLSKLSRLVWGISHRSPSLQEDVTNEVVDALMEHLKPVGAMCVIQAEHGCMACRGFAQQEIVTSTSALRGAFIDEPHARTEFYNLARIK
jgi:GTP cyclohydrolase I